MIHRHNSTPSIYHKTLRTLWTSIGHIRNEMVLEHDAVRELQTPSPPLRQQPAIYNQWLIFFWVY